MCLTLRCKEKNGLNIKQQSNSVSLCLSEIYSDSLKDDIFKNCKNAQTYKKFRMKSPVGLKKNCEFYENYEKEFS